MREKMRFKHIWSVVLFFALMLCLPVQAQAATVVDSGIIDTISWSFYDDGTLELTAPTGSDQEDILDFKLTIFDAPWDFSQVQTLHIGAGVDGIGDWCFAEYPLLTTVIMSDDVAQLGQDCFHGCDLLSSVTLSSGLDTIPLSAFEDCESLNNITIPNSVTKIGDSAFASSSLRSITIPNSVSEIEAYAFTGCEELTAVIFEEPSQKQVDDGSYLEALPDGIFSGCTSLSEVTLSTYINTIGGAAFAETTSLSSICFPACHTLPSLYIATDAFLSSGLKEIFFLDTPPVFENNAFENVEAIAYYQPTFSLWEENLPSLQETPGCQGLQWTPAIICDNTCGTDTCWDFDFDSGELIISGTGSTYNFTSNEYPAQAPWVNLSDQINSVTIEEGVTGLGSFLLEEASPETITFKGDMPTIDADAFYGVNATAYYPAGNSTWTESALQNYGGELTWQSVCTGVDHVFSEEGTVQSAPTCSSTGILLHPCVNCEAGSLEEILDADSSAHSYIRTTGKAATCTTTGYYRYICSKCSDNYIGETIPMLEHTPETINKIDPSCISIGYSGDEICSVCHYTMKIGESIPIVEHTPETINIIDPSCTSTGYSGDVICTVCQNTLESGEILPVGDHSWGDWITVISPSYTHTGLQRHSCAACGKTEEVVLAKLSQSNPFSDLAANAYYYDAVLWAYRQGVTTGRTDTTFVPSDDCLRSEVVTFLWRSVGEPDNANAENPFVDVADTRYYYNAVLWAAKNGITTGTDATHFSPNQPCTRAQVVTFLWRVSGSPVVGRSSSFTDVNPGSFYYDAVAWASQSGITTGTDATHFSPNDTCTRGQIVTFLYRCFAFSDGQTSTTSTQKQALAAAAGYLENLPFSYLGLIEQLEFDGWSHDDAVYAADHCRADWMEQALRHANDYLNAEIGFSAESLTEQLEFEQYTQEQVTYAMENITVDWNEQAAIRAVACLEYSADGRPVTTPQDVIEQLEFEGFTTEQAEYAADYLQNLTNADIPNSVIPVV